MAPITHTRLFPTLALLAIFTCSVGAAEITKIEVYPKPMAAGETTYFFVSTSSEGAIPAPPDQIQIYVDNQVLDVKLVESQDGDYLFTGTAPKDFDGRHVKVRMQGKDYPQGPDDPYLMCDAPYRVKSPSATLPICANIHDAHQDDVLLQYVEVINHATGTLVTSYPIWEWINIPYHYYLFDDLNAANFNCTTGDTAWIKVILYCDDDDIPWIPEEYTYTQILKVRVGRELPAPDGWYYGDVHTHSRYTNNIYEYGGAPEMYAAAAEAIGLSFTTITDHSCDFDSNGVAWGQMAAECNQYSTSEVHLMGCEEISIDDNEVNNPTDNRIHVLNYSGFFIPGPEAPIAMTWHTSERFTFLSEAIALMEEQGGFYYAAHPLQDYDPFAYLIGLAMMPWSDENYLLSRSTYTFSGLELWNERNYYKKNVSYSYYLDPFPWELNPTWEPELAWLSEGIAQWDEFLSLGLTDNLINSAVLPYKQFVSAGSDCHGDFNYRTYNNNPITFDVYATDNAYGNLRTCVHVPGYAPGQLPDLDDIMTAYRLGRSFITDGPCLILGIDINGDGDLDDAEDLNIGENGIIFTSQVSQVNCIIHWESTDDWGTLETLAIYKGTSSTGSIPVNVWSHGSGGYLVELVLPLTDLVSSPTNGWEYLRAEGFGSPQTDAARRAYTNPVWIRIDETPTASVSLVAAEDLILIPENGGSFDYTIAVQNNTQSVVNCDIWMDAVLPSGTVYPLVNVPVTLPGGQTISRMRTQSIPAGAPPGAYAYRTHIGDYPDAWSSGVFAFYKLGTADQPDLTGGWQLGDPLDQIGLLLDIDETSPTESQIEAYPNPFNPVTTITLTLGKVETVNLSVYDLSGRQVAVLADGRLEAGDHAITFDGSTLASGMYFYRLRGDNFTTTGKMLLMK